MIQHKSGHMGVFNTRALEMLGITSETESPAGGLIEKTADGQPTGYMEETAFVSNLQRIPMPDFSALLAAYETAQRKCASYGITTVQEGFFAEQLAPLYHGLLEKKRLWLDVVGYADAASGDALLREFPKAVKQYDRHFKLGGYKMFLDGSPQGRTAWMRTPYRDAPDYFGYGTLSDAKVREFIRLAFAQQMQILAHCNGDAAAEQYIDAVAELERQKWTSLHCGRLSSMRSFSGGISFHACVPPDCFLLFSSRMSIIGEMCILRISGAHEQTRSVRLHRLWGREFSLPSIRMPR